ncbi:MAG: tetratricopeptide repeat protein, partial [Planctomycetota bacterium]
MAGASLFEPRRRRWTVPAAVLALVSLGLLYFFIPTEERLAERDRQTMLHVQSLFSYQDYEGAEHVLRAFLQDRPGSSSADHARYLLAKAIYQGAKAGTFPGVPALEEAQSLLEQARLAGYDAEQTIELRLKIADYLSRQGQFRAAAEDLDRLRQLADPALTIDVSRHLAMHLADQARIEEDAAAAKVLLDKAKVKIDEYLRDVTEETEIAMGLLTKARLLWQRGEFQEMLDLVEQALQDHPDAAERGLLLLEKGKALARLDRHEEAVSTLDAARGVLREEYDKELAVLHQAYVALLDNDPLCRRYCERDLIRGGSRFVALARVFLGIYFLRTGQARPFDELLPGLEALESPDVLERERFDVAWIHGVLRKAWGDEKDGNTLGILAQVAEHFHRLYPDDLLYLQDAAVVYGQAARRFRGRAEERWINLDPARAAKLDEQAASFFYRSGDTYARVAVLERRNTDFISASLRSAADAFMAGGWFPKAADTYYRFYSFRPSGNHEGLYWEGICLAQAGIYRRTSPQKRGALSSLSEYLRVNPEGSILSARALLERGRIHLLLDEYTAAATDFERLYRHPGFGLTPEAREWAEAKRLKGVAELRRAVSLRPSVNDPSLRSQFITALRSAQIHLTEYVERYVTGKEPTSEGLQALFALARAYITDEKWEEAERTLDRLIALAPGVAGTLAEDAEDVVRKSHFLRAEMLLSLGRNAEA